MTMTRDEAKTLVAERLETLTANTAQWAAWARTLGRFHHYSFQNTILIWSQAPDATRVAGYKTWQSLGRYVRKGEHGITIFAPVIHRTPAPPDDLDVSEAPSTASAHAFLSFRTTTVFDVSQTEGEPLALPDPQPLTGDALPGFLEPLVAIIGYPVQFTTLPEGTFGMWTPAEGLIRIRADADPTQQIKTLLHEWSHALGVPDADSARHRHIGPEEVIAETTAMIVAGYCGLDTTAYSQGYVGHWAHGDIQQLQAVAGAIRERVHTQITALESAVDLYPVLAQWLPRPLPRTLPTSRATAS